MWLSEKLLLYSEICTNLTSAGGKSVDLSKHGNKTVLAVYFILHFYFLMSIESLDMQSYGGHESTLHSQPQVQYKPPSPACAHQ